MIRPVVGGGGRTYLKQNLFHSRMIRPVVGGGGAACLKTWVRVQQLIILFILFIHVPYAANRFSGT